MSYFLIYDGNCNLCVSAVQVLENLDRGQQLRYAPMQDQALLDQLGIPAEECQWGMILVDAESGQRWQGSAAAEEIGRLLPLGGIFVEIYRTLPGLKWAGDQAYEMLRESRYDLFGQRATTYESNYPVCSSENCRMTMQEQAKKP